MASIPSADASNPDTAPLVKRIVGERGRLPNRCGVSIHNPPVAQGWLAFLTASPKNCSLFDPRRELSILRIAVINGADPEIRARRLSHRPRSSQCSRSTACAKAATAGSATSRVPYPLTPTRWHARSMFRRRSSDVVRTYFHDRELVELTATLGTYHRVSRFLEAMQIDHDKPAGDLRHEP